MKTLNSTSLMLAIIILFAWSCEKDNSSKTSTISDSTKTTLIDSTISNDSVLINNLRKYGAKISRIDTTFKMIHPALSLFQFNLHVTTDNLFINYDSLVITSESNSQMQKIFFNDVFEDEPEVWASKGYYKGLNFIDLNFDGYLDLDLFISSGANGNYNSLYWLFNPENNLFVFSKELSNLVTVSVDSSQKLIFSDIKAGAAYEYISETYRYINHKLTLIYKESFLPASGKKYHEKKVYKRIDGKLKLVSNKRTSFKNYNYD